MVRLVCQNKKLASASFANLQFWTEGKWHQCMDQKSPNGFMLLDLRVWRDDYKEEKESQQKQQVKI